jgi:hypothetical protein
MFREIRVNGTIADLIKILGFILREKIGLKIQKGEGWTFCAYDGEDHHNVAGRIGLPIHEPQFQYKPAQVSIYGKGSCGVVEFDDDKLIKGIAEVDLLANCTRLTKQDAWDLRILVISPGLLVQYYSFSCALAGAWNHQLIIKTIDQYSGVLGGTGTIPIIVNCQPVA